MDEIDEITARLDKLIEECNNGTARTVAEVSNQGNTNSEHRAAIVARLNRAELLASARLLAGKARTIDEGNSRLVRALLRSIREVERLAAAVNEQDLP